MIPADAKLTPWPDQLLKWDGLTPDEKKLFIRQAEVYAAYLMYTDHEIGRVIQEVEDEGKLDHTLIMYISGDNGASAEGTPDGTPSELLSFNGVNLPIAEQMKFTTPGARTKHIITCVHLGSWRVRPLRIQAGLHLEPARFGAGEMAKCGRAYSRQAHVEYDFKYDGLGVRLWPSIMSQESASPAIHNRRGIRYWRDTGSPVDDQDYRIPFDFTGKIDKLTIAVNQPQLTVADIRKLKEGQMSAADAN